MKSSDICIFFITMLIAIVVYVLEKIKHFEDEIFSESEIGQVHMQWEI